MVARIFKIIVIVMTALIVLAIWAGMSLFKGIDLGGAGHATSPRIIDEYKARKIKMEKMEQLQANLEFTCKHEEKPELSQETQQLYNFALYHDLHNMWTGKKGDAVWNGLARYYRIAAMNGDYKANIRLQYLLKSGRISSDMPQTEVHNLNEELAKQLPATAYYNLYGYLDVGYGVRTEKDGKYAYLRKAADLGSREAQYVVADMLGKINDDDTLEMRIKLIDQLRACASEQGVGDASDMLGIRLGRKKVPFYRIVVADARSPRDGRFIEEVGFYNPMGAKEIKINEDRAKHWLETGAQPTDIVKSLFKKNGIIEK